MSPEDASTIGQLGAYGVLGAIGVYGARKARKAEKQTVATGNGFAKFVTTTLTDIKERGERTEQKIDDHIASHADADVHRRGK